MSDQQKSFGSDNHSGMHPDILKALEKANLGDYHSYGDDPYSREVNAKFKELLGEKIASFLVFNGTGANTLGLKSVTRPFHAIIAAGSAHLHVDECGAPENFTGCKIKLIHSEDGKLTVPQIQEILIGRGDQHHVQARVVSITQASELGTVYKPHELRAIADFVHQKKMLLHMDGSRLANAAAFLGCSLKEITFDCGVDVLSFGGTKNGMMLGEAVIFADKNSPEALEFKFIRKQGMQLFSKMRFLSAQFLAYLANDLWLKNATQANEMAALLAEKIKKFPQLEIAYPVESNGIFVKIPNMYIKPLQQEYFFYEWSEIDQDTSVVRWMNSFNTTQEDIDGFANAIEKIIGISS
jgi:threonine aldolase